MSNKLLKPNRSIFGHTHTFTGYCGDNPYLKAKRGAVDNINRHHVNLYGICDTCNKEVLIAKIHIDAETDKMQFAK
jgi:hypothetical protein